MGACLLRRIALWLEYDGGRYRGFQRLTPRAQAGLRRGGNPRTWPPQKTIQEELEVKLGLLLNEPVSVVGAGRTDQGVHATVQVVAFSTENPMTLEVMLKGLGALLDEGLRVYRAKEVGERFHPRFDAVRRVYHYYLCPSRAPFSPFWGRFCWLLSESLDLDAMRLAARPLLGSHDFSAYSRQLEPDEVRVRHLQGLVFHEGVVHPGLPRGPWAQLQSMICLEVTANAFLRRMVRQLVANLVEVGRGRWPVERPHEILLSRNPDQSAPPAPPQGLFLVDVVFEES